jgi:hypothetical protein
MTEDKPRAEVHNYAEDVIEEVEAAAERAGHMASNRQPPKVWLNHYGVHPRDCMICYGD